VSFLRRKVPRDDDHPDHRTFEEPNESELEWIGANVESATLTVRAATGVETRSPSPEQLDLAFEAWLSAWLEQPESEREDPNPYINVFGIAFGQRLVDDLGFEWKVVTDSEGTEMAVVAQPGEVLVFPPNLVAKRFVTRETGFMRPIYDEFATIVGQLRRGEDPSKTR
jgi:Domain of unknown function (DUF3806)